VVLASAGAYNSTNFIYASVLGFQKIDMCSNLIKSDNSAVVVATPSVLGDAVVCSSIVDGTDANAADGTYVLTVKGKRA
jgi:hypothetical protein